jgi:hypothetical protein
MPDSISQPFLRDLDKKLWSAADRRRANLDAAAYSRAGRDSLSKAARRVDAEASSNHSVLRLIFLKYVSDSFAIRQREIEAQLSYPRWRYGTPPRRRRGRAGDRRRASQQGNANFAWTQRIPSPRPAGQQAHLLANGSMSNTLLPKLLSEELRVQAAASPAGRAA